MAVDWLILLPPSRGVHDGGAGPPWKQTPLADGPQAPMRRRAIAAARKLRGDDLAAAVGSASAVADARRWLDEIHRAPTMPAVERYAGVVYDHLDIGSLGAAARRRAHRRVAIVSGLFGLVAGGDPMPPYRLLMAADLPGIDRLAGAWREPVAAALQAATTSGAVVVDLLSAEYAAAVPAAAYDDRVRVQVDFVRAGTDRRVPGAIGKQLKGRLARHLLEAGSVAADVRADFAHARYRADTDADGGARRRWVFEVG